MKQNTDAPPEGGEDWIETDRYEQLDYQEFCKILHQQNPASAEYILYLLENPGETESGQSSSQSGLGDF